MDNWILDIGFIDNYWISNNSNGIGTCTSWNSFCLQIMLLWQIVSMRYIIKSKTIRPEHNFVKMLADCFSAEILKIPSAFFPAEFRRNSTLWKYYLHINWNDGAKRFGKMSCRRNTQNCHRIFSRRFFFRRNSTLWKYIWIEMTVQKDFAKWLAEIRFAEMCISVFWSFWIFYLTVLVE